MKVLLIGFSTTTLQEMKEKLPEDTQGVHTLEEAEKIIQDLAEIQVVVISPNLTSDENIIPTGEFIERIKPTYKKPILVVTDSHSNWRILRKVGASHWAQNWNTTNLITGIVKDKEVTACST